MKRLLLAFVGLTIVTSMIWVGFANAANVRSGESPHVMSNETIDGTLYAAGNTIRVEGRVQGDLICAGQTLDISGVIEGDVLCAAQNITVSGEVQGSVRVAAQHARLDGKVAGSVSVFGQKVDLSDRSTIGRDLTIVAQESFVNGSVGRDVQVMGENFYANGTLGRSLDVTGTAVSLGDKAVVTGNFVYTSAKDATVPSSARVAGATEHKIPDPKTGEVRSYFAAMLATFSGFLVLGAGLILATPRLVRATSAAVHRTPLITLAAGFAGLVLPPFIAGLLLVTAVGTQLGLVVLFAWVVSVICGLTFSAIALGQVLLKKKDWHVVVSLLLGLIILFGLAFIPYAGLLALLVAVIWGVGAQWYVLVKYRDSTIKPDTKKEAKGEA